MLRVFTCAPLGIKRPEFAADHLPPSRAEIKSAWSFISTSQDVKFAWCLIKHGDNFYSRVRWLTETSNRKVVGLSPTGIRIECILHNYESQCFEHGCTPLGCGFKCPPWRRHTNSLQLTWIALGTNSASYQCQYEVFPPTWN